MGSVPIFPICETLVTETRKKLVKICFDEEIAFEKGEDIAVYNFFKGKFLARVIKGANQTESLKS